MTFRHLECAIEIARCGSINKAASNLIVSQPYLSGIIKALEEEVGYEIFVRTRSGIELTENGKLFIAHAKVIIEESRFIMKIGSGEGEALRVAAYYSTLFMRKYLEFRANDSSSDSDKFREMGIVEVMDAVYYKESNLGLVVFAKDKSDKYISLLEERNLQYRPLFEDLKIHAIMSEEHPLSTAGEISMELIRKYPYVSYDDDSSQLFLANNLGLTLDSHVLKVSGRAGFYDALRTGVYLSVTASPEAENGEKPVHVDKGFVIVPIKDAELYLKAIYIYGKGHKLTTREREFVEYLKA